MLFRSPKNFDLPGTAPAEARERPPLDRALPAKLETATLALG